MQELILLFACLNKTGCEASYSAYYKNNKNLVELVKQNEQKVELLMKPYFVDKVVPFLMFSIKREAILNINKNYTLTFSKDITQVSFKKEF